MTSRYGSDHANKAMEWMASGFVPVTGVAAAYVARCSMIDACTNLLFNVAPALAASKTILLPFNCPVVWERVSKTKSTTMVLCAAVQLSKQMQQTTPHNSSNSVISTAARPSAGYSPR